MSLKDKVFNIKIFTIIVYIVDYNLVFFLEIIKTLKSSFQKEKKRTP
jgi:hypothetical protein